MKYDDFGQRNFLSTGWFLQMKPKRSRVGEERRVERKREGSRDREKERDKSEGK